MSRALVPRQHRRCGILWCDLVGFTPLSKRLGATKLLELLNRIYSAFDALVELHGCVKIDTIGDAFVVLGGLFEDDEELEAEDDVQPMAMAIQGRAMPSPRTPMLADGATRDVLQSHMWGKQNARKSQFQGVASRSRSGSSASKPSPAGSGTQLPPKRPSVTDAADIAALRTADRVPDSAAQAALRDLMQLRGEASFGRSTRARSTSSPGSPSATGPSIGSSQGRSPLAMHATRASASRSASR